MGEDISFKIKKYEDSDKIMWNKFLLKCKNYHFMFNRDFMEYHSDRFEDFSLIFKNDEDEIIALLPGNIKDNIFYSHQGLTFGGFLFDRGMHAADLDSDKIMWNKFLLKCKNYHFMFNRDFMEYHSDRFEDFSLIFKNDEDEIIALLPGNIKDNIFYSHQGLTFGGFLFDRGMHAAD